MSSAGKAAEVDIAAGWTGEGGGGVAHADQADTLHVVIHDSWNYGRFYKKNFSSLNISGSNQTTAHPAK